MREIFIILLILLFAVMCMGQVKIVDSKKLPAYSSGDTIYTVSEVWLQTYSEEIKQRSELINSERKITALKEILHKKRKIEPVIDSLVYELDSISNERDSLLQVLKTGLVDVSKPMLDTIEKYEKKIFTLTNEVRFLVDEKRRYKKSLRICYLVIAGQLILIAL